MESKRNDENFVNEVLSAVEKIVEENEVEEDLFSICEFEDIVDELFGDEIIEWETIVQVGEDKLYAIKSVNEDFAYIFKGVDFGETKSKEDLLTLIFDLNDAYDNMKDRVVLKDA